MNSPRSRVDDTAALHAENELLRARLDEAEQTLEAIRSGDVDALLVNGPHGDQLYSLSGVESAYRLIVETMHEAALVATADGIIRYCNRRFGELLRTPMERVIGSDITHFTAPPQRLPLRTLLDSALLQPVQRRVVLQAGDGSKVPVQVSASRLDADGDVSLCVVMSDLTQLEASSRSLQMLREQQQALEESQALLQSFYDSTPFVMGVAELDGDKTRALRGNAAMETFVAAGSADSSEVPSRQLGQTAAIDRAWVDAFLQAEQTLAPARFEFAVPVDGVEHWMATTVTFLGNDPLGHPRFSFVAEDTTERKLAEDERARYRQTLEDRVAQRTSELASAIEDLRVKEQRWLLALASHDMGVWDWSLPSGLVVYSPRWREMLGYREADIAPRIDAWRELIHPEDGRRVAADLQRCLSGAAPHFRVEFRMRARDGSYRWIYSCGAVTDWSADAQPLRMIGTHTDITEQKTVEREQQRLAPIVEASQDLIASSDLSGHLIYMNRAGRAMLGIPETQSLDGMSITSLNASRAAEDVAQEGIAAAVVHGSWLGDNVFRRADGSEMPVSQLIITHRSGDSGRVEFVTTICRDITDRVLAEKAMSEAREQAEAANRAKSVFLANMSHEIRTPMNAIVGLTHLLMMKIRDPEQHQQLAKIVEAADHLLSLISGILDLSKIESGKLRLEATAFSVDELLQSVTTLMTDKAESKQLAWEAEVDPSLTGRFVGDVVRLRQVLLNFASNALKFTEQGGVSLRADRVGEDGDGVSVRFTVTDTGIGMTEDELSRLFIAFEQADGSITRRFGGTGLGLVISKRLVELMGGDVDVCSEVGRGSTFAFTVRMTRDRQAVADPLRPEIPPASARDIERKHAGARVLLVEDNLINLEVAQEMLKDCALQVDVAENGLQAVELATAHAYDLILMDMQMPVMDGLEAARTIRRLPGRQSVPIIAMTANAFAEDRQACIVAGMSDFLTKPIPPETLYGTVLHWLQNPLTDREDCAGAGRASDPPVLT